MTVRDWIVALSAFEPSLKVYVNMDPEFDEPEFYLETRGPNAPCLQIYN